MHIRQSIIVQIFAQKIRSVKFNSEKLCQIIWEIIGFFDYVKCFFLLNVSVETIISNGSTRLIQLKNLSFIVMLLRNIATKKNQKFEIMIVVLYFAHKAKFQSN